MSWAIDSHSPPILWLTGPAGSGKTAIAQSFAEHCDRAGILVAGVFLSGTNPDGDTVDSVIPSLVYQLALAKPSLQPGILDVVDRNPAVFLLSYEVQLQRLLRGIWPPDERNHSKMVVIIDGLDEARDITAQSDFLRALSRLYDGSDFPLLFPNQ
jgi:MoxR-like ATPase